MCVWVKQFRLSLLWIREFLTGHSGTISRTFHYDSFYTQLHAVEITADASPWGMGAWLTINGNVVSWFAVDISYIDQWMLGREAGSHEGQQAFEALCLLIAMRSWKRHFLTVRAKLSLRSDNMGALAVMQALKGAGDSLNLVAREVALDLAECTYLPQTFSHLPGVANGVADSLSRRFDPSKQPWKIPAMLYNVQELLVPWRPKSWWRTFTYEQNFAPASQHWK